MILIYGSQQDYDVLAGRPTGFTARRWRWTCSRSLEPTSESPRTTGCSRPGHICETAGERAAAREAYYAVARQSTSLPQERYLHARAARLTGDR